MTLRREVSSLNWGASTPPRGVYKYKLRQTVGLLFII